MKKEYDETLQFKLDIDLTPNPASTYIKVKIKSTIFNYGSKGILKLYNFNGDLLISESCKFNDEILIDLQNYYTGLYFIEAELLNSKPNISSKSCHLFEIIR